jgi:Helix-turn-helix domain
MIYKCSEIVSAHNTPSPQPPILFPLRQGVRGSDALPGAGTLVEMNQMEATAEQMLEFMESVPSVEPEPGTIAWARRELREFERLNQENGCLLTGAQAAEVLGVTRAFIRDLAARGKIKRFDLSMGVYYSGNDVKARLEGKPPRGRPRLISGLDKSP